MINLDWLSNTFHIDSIPKHWKCPTCHTGSLGLKKDGYLRNVISSSRRNHIFQNTDYRFVGVLICDNKLCQDVVNFSGLAYDEDYGAYDDEGDPFIGTRMTYEVNHFFPPLVLIEFPQEMKDTIKKEILKSFGHFWNDLASCANKIRIAIEMILDDQGVKKFTINKKNKRVALSTHSRIVNFGIDNPDVSSKMLAIKWIGNDGSHVGEELSRSDLFTDFELLEYIIEKLYNDRDKRLEKIASQINKNKGLKKAKKKTK